MRSLVLFAVILAVSVESLKVDSNWEIVGVITNARPNVTGKWKIHYGDGFSG